MSETLTRPAGPAAASPFDLGYQFDTSGSGSLSFQSVLDNLSSQDARDHRSNDDGVPQPPIDLPGDDGRGDGTAGAVQTAVHQGVCGVAGAILGGAGGAIIGGVGEGLAGAGLGSLAEPGGGTIVGGVAGVADGAKNGAFAGSAAGAALGVHLCGDTSPSAPLPQIHESRADPGLTQPTGAVGGTPTGPRSASQPNADSADKAGVDSENHVADSLAAHGYRTEQNPAEGPNHSLTPERLAAEGLNPGAKPDLLVENRVFDTYTPAVDKAASVRNGIAKKIEDKQTHRVVADLRQTTQTEATVRAALKNAPVRGLKEVIVLSKDGLGQPFRP